MSATANDSSRPGSNNDRADWGRAEFGMLADHYRDCYAIGTAPDIDEATRKINAPADPGNSNASKGGVR